MKRLFVILLFFVPLLHAQNPTGTGTANYIAKWSSSTNLTTSALCQSATGGLVGVATCAPTQRLQVNSGNVLVRGLNNFTAFGQFANYYVGDINHAVGASNGEGLFFSATKHPFALFIQDTTGHVGVNNTAPNALLSVNAADCNVMAINVTRQINDDLRFTVDCNGNVGVASLATASITFADGTVQKTAYPGGTASTQSATVQQLTRTVQQLQARLAQLEQAVKMQSRVAQFDAVRK